MNDDSFRLYASNIIVIFWLEDNKKGETATGDD